MGSGSSRVSGIVLWGSSEFGQLGVPSTKPSSPKQLTSLPKSCSVKQVTCGSHHSAAVSDTGDLFMWGLGHAGQLGLGEAKGGNQPRLVRGPLVQQVIVKVSCGDQHTAAITETGSLFSWGLGTSGRLGHGSEQSEYTPRLVAALSPYFIVDVACGAFHSLALALPHLVEPSGDKHAATKAADGSTLLAGAAAAPSARLIDLPDPPPASTVFSWGLGVNHRLGQGDCETRLSPGAVRGGRPAGDVVRRVIAGGHHSALLTQKGDLYTWGGGAFGKLGHGQNTEDVPTPQVVEVYLQGGSGGGRATRPVVVSASLGAQHCGAVTSCGTVYVWGEAGKLPHPFHAHQPAPISVPDIPPAAQIACGYSHTAVRTLKGEVWAWGTSRLLGHGNKQRPPNVPTDVGVEEIADIACGHSHTMAMADSCRLAEELGQYLQMEEGERKAEKEVVEAGCEPKGVVADQADDMMSRADMRSDSAVECGSQEVWGGSRSLPNAGETISERDLMRMWQLRDIPVPPVACRNPADTQAKLMVMSADLRAYQEQCIALATALQETTGKVRVGALRNRCDVLGRCFAS
eukprot:GHVS01104376.1.p1 GENE.GHVS01104376.1~~GHVS01104376.1.p1  ORF type:complete len:573 (+),score=92.44 GHVS01104376.1:178-1896(+)